jgi:energy-coupling factor transporter ATP-binding protein EcfA2
MTEVGRHSIAGIEVEQLFGQHDIRLGGSAGQAFDSRLVLFYGDNGSGKTTILRLIYHTLSPEPKQGHRTRLISIPVRRFIVTLVNGTVVGVERTGESITGPYKWSLARPGQPQLVLDVVPDSTGTVKPAEDPEERKRWQHFESELLHLGLAVYFLSDDRKPASERPADTGIDIEAIRRDPRAMAFYRTARRKNLAHGPDVLDATVLELENLLRSQVIIAGQTGEENINQIYLRIIRRLLRTKGRDSGDTGMAEHASKALSSLVTRSEAFSALGLMPRLEFNELITQIEREEPETKAVIARVLQPYIDSISARLNALASVQEVIETFVRLLNEFYAGKSASFDLKNGLILRQPNNKKLQLSALSSGEKQLLLLFCATISARAQATIFVIDEPELSLNVKWQRQLLESLLALVKGSNVQFVIATHSIELLAGHRESIVRLDSRLPNGSSESWKSDEKFQS